MQLFVYDHCPYCVKARMIFGIRAIDFHMRVLLNDDIETPVKMIGKKMLPILELKSHKYMPESLDIIEYMDKNYPPPQEIHFSLPDDVRLMSLLDEEKQAHYSLVMPRWVRSNLKEFQTEGARAYFQEKKEKMIGPFDQAMERTEEYKTIMEDTLSRIENTWTFQPEENKFWYVDGRLSLNDFHLFAFLRSLSIVKDLRWPTLLKDYAELASKKSGVNLHFDIAS